MNQEFLMAAPSTYSAPKVLDDLLWQEQSRPTRSEKPARRHYAQQRHDAEVLSEQSLMVKRVERMLQITRLAWAKR